MKKVLLAIAVMLCLSAQAQQSPHSLYLNPSIGPYLNSSIKTPLSTFGYSLEIGYCYKDMVNAGISYGTLDLDNQHPFIQARGGVTLLDRGIFSFGLSGGFGILPRQVEFIGEGDVFANIAIKNDYALSLAFTNQVAYGIGYYPGFSIGFNKTFHFATKKK